MPQVTIIIPTKDREVIFRETLERAYAATRDVDAEIIVVNDSKTNEIKVEPVYKAVQVISNTGQGVASARNAGAAKAQSPLLLFLDDDMWITAELIQTALKLYIDNPSSVFNFNWEYPAGLREQIQQEPFGRFLESIEFTTMKGWCRGLPWKDYEMFRTSGVAGATLLISSKVYFSIKGYEASFPFAGAEDHDFSVRLNKAGYKAYIYPMIKAWHNEVNKTSLRGFLQRTYNNAVTRQHAVSIGYKELTLTFSPMKRFVMYFLMIFIKPLIVLTEALPNHKMLDPIYFKLCNGFISFYIFKGYQKLPF